MTRLALAPLLAVLLTATSSIHATTDTRTAVSVSYDHPEKFTEARETRAFAPSRLDDDYLKTLSDYIQKQAAKKLSHGEQLHIVITNVDLAGSYEPWLGPRLSDVRIVKDIYPPRIDLRFRLTDANGTVIQQGERKLRDPAFMYDQPGLSSGADSLRYEKNLIDRWLRRGPGKL